MDMRALVLQPLAIRLNGGEPFVCFPRGTIAPVVATGVPLLRSARKPEEVPYEPPSFVILDFKDIIVKDQKFGDTRHSFVSSDNVLVCPAEKMETLWWIANPDRKLTSPVHLANAAAETLPVALQALQNAGLQNAQYDVFRYDGTTLELVTFDSE